MRKILIMLIIFLILGGLLILMTQGITIGGIEVKSISDIINNNKDLETRITTLEQKRATVYNEATKALSTAKNKLEESKLEYQKQVTYSTEEQLKNANEIDQYEVGYLWTKIGLYAKKRNLILQADLSSTGNVIKSNDGEVELCNIYFTVSGEYLDIADLIYDIENDKDLGFRIRDFSLVPYSENNLQGKFNITNVGINRKTIQGLSAPQTDTQTSTDGTTTQTFSDKGAGTNTNSDANK